jgi:hypothetical protein
MARNMWFLFLFILFFNFFLWPNPLVTDHHYGANMRKLKLKLKLKNKNKSKKQYS